MKAVNVLALSVFLLLNSACSTDSTSADNAREEAREKAMADAKTKAEQLASLGGVSLGAPVTIVESQTWSEGLKTGVAGQGAADSVSTPIETGTNTVTVDVSVRWALK